MIIPALALFIIATGCASTGETAITRESTESAAALFPGGFILKGYGYSKDTSPINKTNRYMAEQSALLHAQTELVRLQRGLIITITPFAHSYGLYSTFKGTVFLDDATVFELISPLVLRCTINMPASMVKIPSDLRSITVPDGISRPLDLKYYFSYTQAYRSIYDTALKAIVDTCKKDGTLTGNELKLDFFYVAYSLESDTGTMTVYYSVDTAPAAAAQ
jgi:hypothetical protein